ncbi:MAG: holo-ACP synthase [Planctomycetales bacterium]|nr:holo-ACP synthase [bacterium]UNM07013.1 MAG: holo-ACP synthase [Planctomycetales bacterium]
MITGIGLDSIEISRIAEKCEYPGSKFAEKMFTEHERRRSARNSRSPYEHLAGCFAAREAFFKATQIWVRKTDVSVAQRPSGEPYYVMVAHVERELGDRRVSLSITHDRTLAHAICICERPD